MKKYLFILLSIFVFSCNQGNNQPGENEEPAVKSNGIEPPKNISYNIIAVYPHDTESYTQGLQVYNGKFYEGSGNWQKSSVRIEDIKTGKVEHKHLMGSESVFGEGITILNGKLYQLTWKNNIVNVYDVKNIDTPIATFNWPNEGWGITNNGKDLIISDGSANIYFVNPADFKVKSVLQVTDNFGPVDSINELELIDGYLFANVYLTDFILKIDPANGHVVGKINLPGLIHQYAPDYNPKEDEVLNGIAYDSTAKKMYITGKNWPKLFEISLN